MIRSISLSFALFTILFSAPFSHASIWYVDNASTGCSTPHDTDYNPSTRSCGSGSEDVYNTINGAVAVHASNDTIYVRGGTYAEYISGMKSGSGPGLTNVTTLAGYPGETVTDRPASYSGGGSCTFYLVGPMHSIAVKNIIFDGSNCTAGHNVSLNVDSNGNYPSYINFDGVQCNNDVKYSGFHAFMDNSQFINGQANNNGNGDTATGGPHHHGIYIIQGSGNLVQNNIFTNNSGYGIQEFAHSGGSVSNNTFRYNHSYHNGLLCTSCGAMTIAADTDIVEYNLFEQNASGDGISIGQGTPTPQNTLFQNNIIYCPSGVSCRYGIILRIGNNQQINNNTMYCAGSCPIGLLIQAGVTATKFQNNIMIGYSTTYSDSGSGTTLTTNMTTGTPSTIWVNPAALNLTLTDSSPAKQNGTNIGLPFNGANPDQGAYETFNYSSGTISGNVAHVTLGMALNTPVIPSSAGWSLSCSGTGCPVVSVTGATLQPSTTNTVQLLLSATCAVGQTWTVSYSASAGSTNDSIPIPSPAPHQELTSFSNQPLTASCGAPPVLPTIISLLPGNASLTVGSSQTLTVTISAPQSSDTVIPITSSDPTSVTAPSSVTIPSGQTTAQFSVTAVGGGSSTIGASLNSTLGQSIISVSQPVTPPNLVSMQPSNVQLDSGSSIVMTVFIDAVQPGITIVSLSSTNPTVASVPISVTIPASQIQASFQVSAVSQGNATITAILGTKSQISTVQVNSPPIQCD